MIKLICKAWKEIFENTFDILIVIRHYRFCVVILANVGNTK